jgi:large subunit ribosomal protein L3
MGHRKLSAPRHGSLGYRPRKRASSIIPRVRSWPKLEKAVPLGFPAYKVGMTHAIIRDNFPTSPTYGKEVFMAITLLEAPPVVLVALRFYGIDQFGSEIALGEIWAKNPPKELSRVLTLPKKKKDETLIVESLKNNAKRISLIVATQPVKSGIRKKKPEILEIPLGGSLNEQLRYLEKLGKEISVKDVFSPPETLDAIAVTKGKGYEGPVARFGIKIIPKKKAKKTKRGPGADSPSTPGAVMSSASRAGQMGYHNRVDLNKILVRIEEPTEKLIPKAGFKHYGVPKSTLLFISGSVPGPVKRLILLRKAIRSYKALPKETPLMEYLAIR